MAETQSDSARPTGPVGRALLYCSFLLAVAGGLLMASLAIMTVVSVIGRKFFAAPVPGDFELMQVGNAVAVFLFLPYCHLMRGNVIVDIFLSWAPRRVQIFCDAMAGLILSSIAGMLAWRAALGGIDMFHYNEVTYILGIPIWPAFPFAALSLALLSLNAIHTALRDLRDCVR